MTVSPNPSFRHRILNASYQQILKPILFSIDAESVHSTFLSIGERLGAHSVTQLLTRSIFDPGPDSPVTVNGVLFPNRIGLAAGFDYTASVYPILPDIGFGHSMIGTITLEGYAGNEPPRLGRFPLSKALLVNKGFKNAGATIISKKIAGTRFRHPVGISIGSTNKSYQSIVEQIAHIVGCFKVFEKDDAYHSFYELNISCPNLKGGVPFTSPQRLHELLAALTVLPLSRPVYLKMPIDLDEEQVMALLAEADQSFIAGVNFGNLTKDHQNPDVHSLDRKKWMSLKGNLSGKPTWLRSNTLLAAAKKRYKNRFTLIGTGGIFSEEDAIQKLELGADLLQLITGMIYEGPQLIGRINRAIAFFSR